MIRRTPVSSLHRSCQGVFPHSERSLPRLCAQLGLILALGAASACIRYVPPRAELEARRAASSDPRDMVPIVGAQEFLAHEAAMRKKLEALVAERSQTLNETSDLSYRVGSRDILSVTVFGLSELSADLEVSATGNINPSLVGEIYVKGESLGRIQEQLTASYRRFVRNPHVTVTVKDYQANKVSIVGEVNKPGLYPLKSGGRLLSDVVSEAGGRTDKAGARIILTPAYRAPTAPAAEASPSGVAASPGSPNVQVALAQPNSSNEGIEIDYEDLVGGPNRQPILIPLLAGDTVSIPPAGSFEVDGEVTKPGAYNLTGRTSALGAVAAAGGFTYSANVNSVEIIREIDQGKKASISVNLEDVALNGGNDIRLRDGDVIRVPSDSGRFTRRQVVEVLNGLFRGVGVNGRVN